MSRNENRRRWSNVLVLHSFQLRLALIHTMFVMFVVVVLVSILLAPLYYEIPTTGEKWHQYIAAQIVFKMMDRVAVVVLLIIAISVIYQIIFSHRLCGPLINMGHTFDYLSKGDMTHKVFLRRKDFLKEEAARINDMIASLNTKVGMLKKIQADLSSTALQLPVGLLVEDRLRMLLQQNQMLLDQWTVDSSDLK